MNDTFAFWTRFATDLNGDQQVTIDDFGIWLKELLILPGDVFVYALVNYAPGVAQFLNVSPGSHGGVVAIWAAIIIWVFAIVVTGIVLTAIREFLGNMRARIRSRVDDVVRVFRVVRRRVVSTIRFRRQKSDMGLSVNDIALAKPENAILRCLASIDDNAVLTIDEIAARLGRKKREVRPHLQKLVDLSFVEPGADRFAGKDGLKIAQAGQMYLLGA